MKDSLTKKAVRCFVIATALSVAMFLITACGGSGAVSDPGLSAVAPSTTAYRKDLKYGYYGSNDAQLSETVDHINIFMAANWGGQIPESQLSQMIAAKNAGIPIIMDLPEAWQPIKGVFSYDPARAQLRVTDRFAELERAGVLHSIVAFYPRDEPDLPGSSVPAEQVIATNTMIRKVMADFKVTAKLAVIYAPTWTWPGIESYDWVGFDQYGVNIFTNGSFNKLKSVINKNGRVDQKIILVPGGADKWAEDPIPFFNQATLDPDVIMIMAFIWLDNADPTNGAFAGIRSNKMNAAYKSVGMKISHPTRF